MSCKKCGGLIAEVGKAYGYTGRFCNCKEPEMSIEETMLTNKTTPKL